MDGGPMINKGIRQARFLRDGKSHIMDYDHSGDLPVCVGSFVYPASAKEGQTDNLPGLPGSERAHCAICRSKKLTTVNGVCLDCVTKRSKYVPR